MHSLEGICNFTSLKMIAEQKQVLNGGKVVEYENHTTPIKKKDAYFNLVKNQLELGI